MSVATVHADRERPKPGAKLFDLVNPGEFKAGNDSFFEAPPDTVLIAEHLLRAGLELPHRQHGPPVAADLGKYRRWDSGELTDFSIADGFYSGADIGNLAIASAGHALEIAVYGDDLGEEPEAMEEPLFKMVQNLEQR